MNGMMNMRNDPLISAMGETITGSNDNNEDSDDDDDDDDNDYEWNTNPQHVVTYKHSCYRDEEVFKMFNETQNL
jgi:hypothetical protein